MGPDGPWNFIENSIDFPDQNLYFYPSLTTSSVIVPNAACQNQSSECPLPLPPLYQQTGAQSLFKADDSSEFDASTWDNISLPLNLVGTGYYILQRITVDGNIADGNGFVIASNFTVRFPGGAYYTQDIGFLSLNSSGDGHLTWLEPSGNYTTANKTLQGFYSYGYIPSISYGLHLGSAVYNTTGSLYLGGYDRSRCISPPLNCTGSETLELLNVYLNVSSGGSAYTNLTSTQLPFDILPKQGNNPIIRFESGAPYMYLSQATCDALAAHLPVTYERSLNLYIWNNITSTETDQILTSPHYISFSFTTSSGSSTSIAVPFALLNLTLTSPIVSQTMRYFPCSPFSPPDGRTYILGRAFLQGAFLAQNWQSDTLWLAQAPGPATPSEDIRMIQSGDLQISSVENPPTWEETWSSVLTALPLDEGGVGTTSVSVSATSGLSVGATSGPSADATSGSATSGLSGGAKAGISVGAAVGGIALVLVVALFWQRWGVARRGGESGQAVAQSGYIMMEIERHELPHTTRHELGSNGPVEKPAELSGNAIPDIAVHTMAHQGPPVELEGEQRTY